MRGIDIVGTAIRSTFRSKLRTTLTVIAIFIGAFTLTITTAIGTGVSNYINTQVTSIGAGNVMTVTKAAVATAATGSGPQKYSPTTATGTTQSVAGPPTGSDAALTAKDITKIAAVKGVLTVQPSVRVSPDYIEYGSAGKYVLSVNSNAQYINADLAAGSQLSASAAGNQVMLPTTYLSNLGLGTAKNAIGSSVTVGVTDYLGGSHTVAAKVVGVQNESLFGGGVGFNSAMTKAVQAEQNTGKPTSIKTSYGSAAITFATGANAEKIAALKASLKDAGYSGQTVADQLGTFELVINGIVGVLDAFAIIALIAAGFGIINTLLMSVQERTREIGLMKAMGMGGGGIFAMFSIEAIFIGFLGSAIGVLFGMGIGSLISSALSRTVLSGLPGLHLLQFAPASIITIILVVMFIAFLAGTLPARRAARQNPIDALRYE
jgi:putative ABC transport system permease protein